MISFDSQDFLYINSYLAFQEAEKIFNKLQKEICWQEEVIRLFGRQIIVPRLVAWHGDEGVSYRYSSIEHVAKKWTPTLKELQKRLIADFAIDLNSVLLNYYRDGKDSMGWHSDDESELGDKPFIASISLGAERYFAIREKHNHHNRQKLLLANGSLVIMKGNFQKKYQHALPKMRLIAKPRINLTFRLIKNKGAKNAS